MNKYIKIILLLVSYIIVVCVSLLIHKHTTQKTVEVVQVEQTDTGELITLHLDNDYIKYYYEY